MCNTMSADLLLHPVRLRIIQALVGHLMTPLELKDQLGDVSQATLYRHINQLHDGDLIEVVSERQVRGGIERTLGVVESAVQLGSSEFEEASPDDHLRYFVTFVGSLIANYGAYLDSGEPDLADDRVGYQQVPLWLTDDEFDTMASELREAVLSRFDNKPDANRKRRLVTSIVMPDRRTE